MNFNPRSPRGERLVSMMVCVVFAEISTLAPREGSDGWIVFYVDCR